MKKKKKLKTKKGLLTPLPDDVLRTVNETYLTMTKSFSPVALSVSLDQIVVSYLEVHVNLINHSHDSTERTDSKFILFYFTFSIRDDRNSRLDDSVESDSPSCISLAPDVKTCDRGRRRDDRRSDSRLL